MQLLTLPFQRGHASPPIAEGLSKEQWVALLHTERAKWACKSLNYLDGKQHEEVVKFLSDPECGRKDWRARGFVPRYRNITAAVVEKSGTLYRDKAPTLEVWTGDTEKPDDGLTQRLSDELHKLEWVEFFSNLDRVVRLLKTALVLVQWDPAERMLVLDVLHRGNCEVVLNPATRQISSLIHRTSDDPEHTTYRIWTPDEVIDLQHQGTEVTVINVEPNTLGVVPAAVFYDTASPRSGFWVEAPQDLVSFNELLNIHLTDSERAIQWAKNPTLFTNGRFRSSGDDRMEVAEVYGSPLPRLAAATPSLTGGPGQAVLIDSTGVESLFIDYKGPNPDLKSLDEVVMGWAHAFASDWSVRMDVAGEGRASSGFQLVVEELPNIDLRRQRTKAAQAGFKRLFRVLRTVLAPVMSFPEQAELYVTFPEPVIATDPMEREQLWTERIKQGRATVIDYFVEVLELTPEEAAKKHAEIVAFNAANATSAQPQTDETEGAEPDAADQADSLTTGT